MLPVMPQVYLMSAQCQCFFVVVSKKERRDRIIISEKKFLEDGISRCWENIFSKIGISILGIFFLKDRILSVGNFFLKDGILNIGNRSYF